MLFAKSAPMIFRSFWSDRNGDSEIYVMNRNGTAQTRITTSPGHDQGSDWRPRDTALVSR